jgi:hypothetical protein
MHGAPDDFANAALTARIRDEQFLQGPLADAMTHAPGPRRRHRDGNV